MGTVRRQLDKMDAAFRLGEKSPDIRAFVAGGIVPDDVDQALVGVARLNFGEKLRRADAVDGDWVCTAGFDPALTQPKAGFV